jgi:hypothetical protein
MNKNEHGGEGMPLRPRSLEFDFDIEFGLRYDTAAHFKSV